MPPVMRMKHDWYIVSWDNFWIEFGFPPVCAQRFPG